MTRSALRFFRVVFTVLALPMALTAHPMGNFSVSHYSRLYFRGGATELTYVLDLAEIPAFELLGSWQIDWKDQKLLAAKCSRQAAEWLDNVILMQAGQRLPLRIRSISPAAVEGAGGLPVLRISVTAVFVPRPGEVTYEDRNFPGRAGWKEIVIDHDRTVTIPKSSHSDRDISKALTFYPTDPGIAQPQDLNAQVEWFPVLPPRQPPVQTPVQTRAAPGPESLSAVPPEIPPSAAPVSEVQRESFSQRQPAGPGSVVRGDFLSNMLQQRKLSGRIILLGILVAFGLGAMHAMSPGHGKTIVAAYLVGSRGTLKHAGVLGLAVTFTHTFTVFLLGLGILFFQQYFAAEKIMPLLGAASGLSIAGVGLMLLYQRARALMEGSIHSHYETSPYPETQRPRTRIAELRAAEAGQTPTIADVGSHAEGEITPGSLIALGVSGGIVPCPSALILMLSAIALGHAGVGLVLLIAFSTGLALVLMACGALAIYAKHLLPTGEGLADRPLFRLVPVFSAVVVICLGLVMTGVSAGWIQPLRFLS